ncbi:hypothetical protein BDQ17DRAFT_267257 [Cyathus striatus]|nr:hypothetical protein BDQ17DRAFT_267257 [Cyathus striatus]
MLILDVKTRWSSTHQMLRRALKFQEVIDSFVTRPAHREFFGKFELDTIEWNTIRLVANWLESFRSATTQMSITKMPMLSQTGAIFQGLQETVKNTIRDLPPSAPSKLRDGLVAAHLKLSEYYERFDESPLYTWAACTSYFTNKCY